MKYARTDRFKNAYAKLPPEIQAKVIKAFQLFKENPRHPVLGIKRVQGMSNVWEGRIDIHYLHLTLRRRPVCLSQHWATLDHRT